MIDEDRATRAAIKAAEAAWWISDRIRDAGELLERAAEHISEAGHGILHLNGWWWDPLAGHGIRPEAPALTLRDPIPAAGGHWRYRGCPHTACTSEFDCFARMACCATRLERIADAAPAPPATPGVGLGECGPSRPSPMVGELNADGENDYPGPCKRRRGYPRCRP